MNMALTDSLQVQSHALSPPEVKVALRLLTIFLINANHKRAVVPCSLCKRLQFSSDGMDLGGA